MVFMESEIDPADLDHVYDATDEWQEYQKGKTVECECGQGFGVDFDVEAVKCPTCGKQVIDREADSRGEGVQMDLTQF